MPSAGPLEIVHCESATSHLHGSAGDAAPRALADCRTAEVSVPLAAAGRNWEPTAADEPDSEDEALRAAVPAGAKKAVPATAAVPGSGDGEPLAGVAACNLTLGVARVAEPQDVAAVAGRRNSGIEAVWTGDVPLPGAVRVANNLSIAALPTGDCAAGGIPKADDIPDKMDASPTTCTAPA